MRPVRTRIETALVAAILTLLYGCASRVTVPPLAPAEAAAFREAGNHLDENYRLEPGDTLSIVFPFHPEMDHQETIRPDGRITMAEIGEIEVFGLTTTALEEALKTRTSHFLRDPEVRVTVAYFAEKAVYVTGEVGRPGPIVYRLNLTPLQAVSEAGGLLDTAHVESVVWIRSVGPDDPLVSRSLNLQEMATEGAEAPFDLAPGDILYVPRTRIADADLWVDQHVTRLFPFLRGTSARFPLGF